MDFLRVLALAPHTDDVELGAGGTVARWVEEGKKVIYAAFSIAERSLPEGFPDDTLHKEAGEATKILGIRSENLHVLNYQVREFPAFRQPILEQLIQLRDTLKPDTVLIPSLNDIHQDHRVVAEEAIRAFKYSANILCYQLSWNMFHFNPTYFVILSPEHLEKKMRAIDSYKSQRRRDYTRKESVYGLAKSTGVQIACEYAEAFEIVRWISR